MSFVEKLAIDYLGRGDPVNRHICTLIGCMNEVYHCLYSGDMFFSDNELLQFQRAITKLNKYWMVCRAEADAADELYFQVRPKHTLPNTFERTSEAYQSPLRCSILRGEFSWQDRSDMDQKHQWSILSSCTESCHSEVCSHDAIDSGFVRKTKNKTTSIYKWLIWEIVKIEIFKMQIR